MYFLRLLHHEIKLTVMKLQPKKALLITIALPLMFIVIYAFTAANPEKSAYRTDHTNCTPQRHLCVMKTIFGLEDNSADAMSLTPAPPVDVEKSIRHALQWTVDAQLENGGWGAGSYMRQDIRDPHAVDADPATTSLVLISLLRTGNNLEAGTYKKEVNKGTLFLLNAVDDWSPNEPRLTSLQGTQPQQKLGQNIDAILTAQYFSTLLKYQQSHPWNKRIKAALQKCVERIQKEQDYDGNWKDGGWAPVLQSALADQALENAKDAGMKVDDDVLKKSKEYQKSNFDVSTNSAVTGKAAGVMLYSLSSTTRSSAKEAKKAKAMLDRAKKEGKLKAEDEMNEENLEVAGATPAEAKELATAHKINQSTKTQSTREDVMSGFGSNGGEELISYLLTGESIVMEGGNEWKSWYNSMSKKIMNIQKQDGSWEGHHCITSPVFCTAAALLILSITNDIDN
jgi:hypothetical protein